MNFSLAQLGALLPFGVLGLGLLLLVLVDAVSARVDSEHSDGRAGSARGTLLAAIACATLLGALGSLPGGFWQPGPGIEIPGSLIVVDGLSLLAFIAIGLVALLCVLLSFAYLSTENLEGGEYYALMLLSTLGAFVAVSCGNLLSLLLGIELMSLPIYILAGFDRDRLLSNEAGQKAHAIGIVASAVMLYGIALLYGATGQMDYRGIGAGYSGDDALASAGLTLVAVGLLTRVAAVPFHQWLPDVAVGAPVTVSAFLSTIPVIAGFLALLRLFAAILPSGLENFSTAFEVIAIASMLLGALLALVQSDVKRMIAFAGISHIGFMLMGLSIWTHESRAALLFYLLAFVFMQLGAYGSIAALSPGGRKHRTISDYSGLADRQPILAAALGLFLFSLAGLPGTSGFMGRFILMSTALEADRVGLALMMALTSVALFASYLKIPTAMYMGRNQREDSQLAPIAAIVALAICASITLYLGVFPGAGPLAINALEWVRQAAP